MNTSIRTAVILFPEESERDVRAPFQHIAGLTLLQRQLLRLWQHRIGTVYLSAPPPVHATLAAHIRDWRKDRNLPRTVLGDSPEGTGPGRFLVLDARFLHHPDLFAHALSAEGNFVYVDNQGRPCGLGVADPQRGVGPDTLSSLPGLPLPEGLFALSATNPAEAREAEKRLFASFIKPTDGWFAKHLNRPVSLAITRRIVHLPLHPNVVTVFTLLVGILAGWSAALGSFSGLAAGGVLFQLASILDGVDGEIARARLLHSKTGEWLDTVCDDLTNAIFIFGVTSGLYRATNDAFWLVLGMLSLVVYGATLTIMYGVLITNKRKPTLLSFQEEIRKPGYNPGRLKAWLVSLQPFIKRDFYGFAFMFAGFLDLPELIIAGWLVGSLLTLFFIRSEWKNPFSGKAAGKIGE